MNHWLLNCREVTYMVSESLDRKLPIAQRMGIRMHLFMCKFCTRFRRQLLTLSKMSKFYGAHEAQLEPSVALSPEARARITQAIRQQ